jgi:thiol-disulfide isomerase/thioredoxin
MINKIIETINFESSKNALRSGENVRATNFLSTKFHFLIMLVLSPFIFTSLLANPPQKTIIRGMVINFDESAKLPILELLDFKPFMMEWNNDNQHINDDGMFCFEIEQLYPKEIFFNFKKRFSIYSFPGDSIFLTIDAKMLSDTIKNRYIAYKYITAECPHQKFQEDYLDYTMAFNNDFLTNEEFSKLKNAQKELDYSDYTEYIKDRTARYSVFLKKYIKRNKSDKDFLEWARNAIYAQELNDLIRYEWLHPRYNAMDEATFRLPVEFYSFLKDPRHNDEKLLTSFDYCRFLDELYSHINRRFIHSDLGGQFSLLFKAGNKIEANRLFLNYIDQNTTAFEHDFFLSRFFSQLLIWKFTDVYDALYDPSLIDRDDFNMVLTNKYGELKNLILSPVYAKDLKLHNPESTEDGLIFSSLPERYPDKVIYVDFWAPWCGPCMGEMPHTKELQDRVKGKDIVFVFLAVRCTEQSWKATIAQKKLPGEHFLISEKEYSTISDKFNIVGIPRYMIIDKKGKVVEDNAPRPGDESLVILLESLL